jgi:hypothetical protein
MAENNENAENNETGREVRDYNRIPEPRQQYYRRTGELDYTSSPGNRNRAEGTEVTEGQIVDNTHADPPTHVPHPDSANDE